jgi:hypothetical protein
MAFDSVDFVELINPVNNCSCDYAKKPSKSDTCAFRCKQHNSSKWRPTINSSSNNHAGERHAAKAFGH